jgi:hypothetical protein
MKLSTIKEKPCRVCCVLGAISAGFLSSKYFFL